jgi:hypothetical protein
MLKYERLTAKSFLVGPDECRLDLRDFSCAEVSSTNGAKFHCKGPSPHGEVTFYVDVGGRVAATMSQERLRSLLPSMIYGKLVDYFTEIHPAFEIPKDHTFRVVAGEVDQ